MCTGIRPTLTDLTGVERPAQHADGGGLTRPIWPDQAVNFTGCHAQAQVVDGPGVTEGFMEVKSFN
jgi:hypothetical protein